MYEPLTCDVCKLPPSGWIQVGTVRWTVRDLRRTLDGRTVCAYCRRQEAETPTHRQPLLM